MTARESTGVIAELSGCRTDTERLAVVGDALEQVTLELRRLARKHPVLELDFALLVDAENLLARWHELVQS